MLDTNLNAVSRVLDISCGELGDSLKSIVSNDEEFRIKFMQLVHDTYNRLQKNLMNYKNRNYGTNDNNIRKGLQQTCAE